MYKFAGLYYPEPMSDVLHELSKHSWEELDLNSLDLHTVKFNNAKQAVTSWVHKLGLQKILVLQESCSNVMRLLGYNTINDKRDLEAAKSLWEMNTPATVEKLGCTTCNWSPSDHNVDGSNVEIRKKLDLVENDDEADAKRQAEARLDATNSNNDKINLQQQLISAIQSAQNSGAEMLNSLGNMAGFQMAGNQMPNQLQMDSGMSANPAADINAQLAALGINPNQMPDQLGQNPGMNLQQMNQPNVPQLTPEILAQLSAAAALGGLQNNQMGQLLANLPPQLQQQMPNNLAG